MYQLLFTHPEYAILFGVIIYLILMYAIYRIWDAMQPKIFKKYVYRHDKETAEKECKNIFKYNQPIESISISELCEYLNESVN
jgi:hypothetical protein